ncbi:hypothetical protein [Rickettsia endosymbiont of Gonocerus acuteangulatus]|uniref:hypothetical protein n=1 Tax=Rickettsia endosymbiont of Gonocerus acuteangulatus TaxID=3066266 RepID=UPI003132EDA3
MLIPPYYAASGGEYTQKRLNNLKLEKLITFFDTKNLITLYQFQDINNISIHYIKTFLEKAHGLNFHHTETFKSLNSKLTDLLPKIDNLGERSLKLIKTQPFKKLSPDLKDLVEKVYIKFTESLQEFKKFLDQKQLTLKEEIEELLPEILQILCTKIKEWYNIDASEYITNVKTVEELKNTEVLKDITAKINNSNSIFSQSRDKLKFSIPPIKRKIVSTENINNKLLKTHNEETYDSSLDDAIKEYYKIMGEDRGSISL